MEQHYPQLQYTDGNYKNRTVVKNLHVRRLVLRESGRYDQMYRRPNYLTSHNANDLNSMTASLANYYVNNGGKLGDVPISHMAVYANDILEKGAPQLAKIENGWNESRLNFLLEIAYEVDFGDKMIETFIGYGEHLGAIATPTSFMLDESMLFRITNMMRRRITYRNSPSIGMTESSAVLDRQAVLSGPEATNIGNPSGQTLTSMRPYDVAGIAGACSVLSSAAMESMGVTQSMIYSTATINNNSGVASSQIHNSPVHFLSDLINFGVESVDKDMRSGEHPDIDRTLCNMKTSMVRNKITSKSYNFLQKLNSIKNSFGTAHQDGTFTNPTFNFHDLQKIDNTLTSNDNRIDFSIYSQSVRGNFNYGGRGDGWGGTHLEDNMAYHLVSTIPALMFEHGISAAQISADNLKGAHGTQVFVSFPVSLDNDDMSDFSLALSSAIYEVVVPYISFNGNYSFIFSGNFSIINDNLFNISINGSPMKHFAIPGVCSSVYAPVTTSDLTISKNNGNSLNLMLEGIREVGYELRNRQYDSPRIFTGNNDINPPVYQAAKPIYQAPGGSVNSFTNPGQNNQVGAGFKPLNF